MTGVQTCALPICFPVTKPQEVVFEIGSGMGEATSHIAANNPETAYVAVEVHKPGLGALIIRAESLGVRNLKIINDDIFEVLTKHIADHTIDAFHIFFPDPWPKRKQHKRRLLQPNFIAILAAKINMVVESISQLTGIPTPKRSRKTSREIPISSAESYPALIGDL